MTDPIAAARSLIERLTEYTPGPWYSDTSVVGTMIDDRYEWSHIASIGEVDRHHKSEKAANARLIAAAPTLRDMVATLADALVAERGRAEKAEAERDTAWNDAIEAAKGCVDDNHPFSIMDEMDLLKKGDSHNQQAERAKVAAAYEAAAREQERIYRRRVFGEKHPDHIRALTPSDAQAALDKMLAGARAMESMRADNLMRERNDALMRLGSLTEHLARLAEAKDHADGEPETDFDRGYDQAGNEIAAMIRDTEHNAQIILGEMLADARLEGWRAGRDDAAEVAVSRYEAWSDEAWPDPDGCPVVCDVTACADVAAAIRALPEPKENNHV